MSDITDQKGLGMLYNSTNSTSHTFCRRPADCHKSRGKATRSGANTAIIRHYTMPWHVAEPDDCWLADEQKRKWLTLDPCHREGKSSKPSCVTLPCLLHQCRVMQAVLC